MTKKNDDFFDVKKPWSEVKDELLGCYLKPYFQKILCTRKSIVYVDCFAGKGIFGDGKPGSPLIALRVMRECLSITKQNTYAIQPYFIDLNYAEDLRVNLSEYNRITIISGKYEERIEDILCDKKDCNVFLYIDPYGIKALNYSLFDMLASRGNFNSIELLINMNSFGFIREGCRVLGAKFEDEGLFEDLIEYDSTRLTSDDKSKIALNAIAGGDYWIAIIEEYKRGLITVYDAEARFAEEYCMKLRQSYAFVLNMPLRIKRGQVPKYRMIHATNHADGSLLMVDNICGRWELMESLQSSGEQTLWEENIENELVDEMDIREKVYAHISSIRTSMRLNHVLANFYSIYGVICPTKTVKDIYKTLEKNGHIVVMREPAYTKKTSKPTSFFADEKGKVTKLRWKG